MNENVENNVTPTPVQPVVETPAPVAPPAATPVAAPVTAPVVDTAPVSPYSFAALRKKWWFWAILAGCLVGLIFGIAKIGDGGSSSGGSSSGSSFSTPSFTDPYVRMVKEATHSSYGIEYGKAFDRFFSSPSWRSFDSTSGQKVVEFTGRFTYSGSPATAKIQFVLDIQGGTFTAYYLSINDVSQNKLMLSAMIQKVFESYY